MRKMWSIKKIRKYDKERGETEILYIVRSKFWWICWIWEYTELHYVLYIYDDNIYTDWYYIHDGLKRRIKERYNEMKYKIQMHRFRKEFRKKTGEDIPF